MNKIEFMIENVKDLGYTDSSGHVVRTYIDGKSMLDQIHAFEKRFGVEKNSYEGSPLGWLRNDLGRSNTIFSCSDCLEPGCWPIQVDIEETPTSVIWKNFRNPYHSKPGSTEKSREFWDYSEFPSFEFDKGQYQAEVDKLQNSKLN